MITEFQGIKPEVDASAYVADSAEVIGKVRIGKNVSIWPKAVLRGDLEDIVIGDDSNVQDCCVAHTNYDLPTVVGRKVTVGHAAILHGCTVGDNCLVGMGAILLDGCRIEENCVIAAGSIITQNKVIPAGSLVMGIPGKVVRQLKPGEIELITRSSAEYVEFGRKHGA